MLEQAIHTAKFQCCLQHRMDGPGQCQTWCTVAMQGHRRSSSPHRRTPSENPRYSSPKRSLRYRLLPAAEGRKTLRSVEGGTKRVGAQVGGGTLEQRVEIVPDDWGEVRTS